ncbi:MAG: hypothetical protein KDA21_13725, partial [Phycisphaerales bacterium]|nr:hypothetical protein [Phycisphaerales bacterium]
MVSLSRLIAVALLALAGAAPAQEGTRPVGADRVVRLYDFEDPTDHLVGIPEDWVNRLHDPERGIFLPDYPPWNQSRFDDGHAASGGWSVKLPLDGGSSAIRIASGTVGIFPDGDYTVACMVRTDNFRNARARVIARLLKADGEPIAASEMRSEPMRTFGDWRRVELQMRGHPDAQFIQIELAALQRDLWEDRARRRHEVWREDRNAAAWFDDVVIFQSPRIEFTSNATSNIILQPDAPEVSVRVRDLTGEPLTVFLTVFDENGREVDAAERPVPFTGAPFVWRPALPRLGWYRVVLQVANDHLPVGRTSLDLLWLPALNTSDRFQRTRFGVDAEGLTSEQRRALPEFVRRAGMGAVTLSVWDQDLTESSLSGWTDEMSESVNTLLEQGVQITFAFDRLPSRLASEVQIEPIEILRLFGESSEGWAAYLTSVLSRFGERARRWQIGGIDNHESFWQPQLEDNVRSARSKLTDLVPRVEIVVPWRAEQAPDQRTGAFDVAALTVPHRVGPDAVPELLAEWKGHTMQLLLEPLPASKFGHHAAASDLIRRAVLAHRVSGTQVSLPSPWNWNADNRTLMPAPELSAWRVLSDELAGRTITHEIPLIDGVRMFIATGELGEDDDSVLIGWNDSAAPEDAIFSGYLGDSPVSVMDMNGNITSLKSEDGVYRIPISESPSYIKGINPRIAQFRAGLRLKPDFLEARVEKHAVNVVVHNPWPVAASGRVRLPELDGWEINPRVTSFTLRPGETREYPVELFFGLGEESGVRDIPAEVELVAERSYPLLRIPLKLEI